MAQDIGSEMPGSGTIESPETTRIVENYLEYLKTSFKSPLRGVLGGLKLPESPKEGSAPAWSEAEILAFNAKLVDSGILPETTTTEEIGISSEDKARLQSMTPSERSAAVLMGMKNVVLKAIGLPEVPGGVKFQRVEVTRNNRTGEEKAIPLPSSPQTSTPTK